MGQLVDAEPSRAWAARVLLALDASPDAVALAVATVRLARAIDASLTLLHVVRVPEELVGATAPPGLGAEVAEARAAMWVIARRACAMVPVALDVRIEISSSPARTTVECAAKGAFDVVVLGTRPSVAGAAGSRGALVDYVRVHASCAVLTVPLERAPGSGRP